MEVLYDYYTYNFRLYFPVKGHICVYKHQKHHEYNLSNHHYQLNIISIIVWMILHLFIYLQQKTD